MRILLILLLLYPFIEIAALITLANYIGRSGVMIYLFVSAVIGIVMIRGQKITTLRTLRDWVQRKGELPSYALLWPIRYAGAGIFFLIPGVINKVMAILILLPLGKKPTRAAADHASAPEDGVIEGEFQRIDKDKENPDTTRRLR